MNLADYSLILPLVNQMMREKQEVPVGAILMSTHHCSSDQHLLFFCSAEQILILQLVNQMMSEKQKGFKKV